VQLLRLQDVPTQRGDRVYRHPRLRAVLVWLAGVGLAASLLVHAVVTTWPPGYIFGVPLLYRSYLNYEMSAEIPSVVMLSLGEIASAHLVKERVETPDPMKPGSIQVQWLRYVDLELSGDDAALVQALQAERAAPAPVRKHWYGSSSMLYRDYPLSICEPGVLRIHWNVTPSAQKFLNALRPYTGITDSVSLSQDFHHLKTLGPQEQRAKIRELAARGDTMTAVYIARKLYGGSLGQAKQMVDSLGTTTA